MHCLVNLGPQFVCVCVVLCVHTVYLSTTFGPLVDDEEGGAKVGGVARVRLESTSLEEQVQYLEERLSLLRAQKAGGMGVWGRGGVGV